MRTKLVNGIPVPLTAQEEAARDIEEADDAVVLTATAANRARLAEFDSAIAGDANLQAFKGMTKAGFDAWWAANVTTAAQAIGVLKKLCWVLLRRVL